TCEVLHDEGHVVRALAVPLQKAFEKATLAKRLQQLDLRPVRVAQGEPHEPFVRDAAEAVRYAAEQVLVQGQRRAYVAYGDGRVVQGHDAELTGKLVYASLALHGNVRTGGSLPRGGTASRAQRIPAARAWTWRGAGADHARQRVRLGPAHVAGRPGSGQARPRAAHPPGPRRHRPRRRAGRGRPH